MEVIYIIGSLVGMSILIYGRVHFGKKGLFRGGKMAV